MKQTTIFVLALLLLSSHGKSQDSSAARQSDQSSSFGANLPIMPVGVDDLISVQVYDSPELTRTVRVNADGTIRLPMLKQKIKVDGMMPSAIETAISKQLEDGGILVNPVVTVSVAEYRSRPISVVGAVRSAVTFQALPGTRLMNAITQAGGLSETAGPDIIVTRHLSIAGGKSSNLSQRIPARALLEGNDPSLNLPLSGGEEVRVLQAERFFVMGEVRKSGAFPVQQQNDATVIKAIAMAEGLDRYAGKTAYIIRKEGPNGRKELPIQLSKILQQKAPDVPLEPNDILYVPDSTGKRIAWGSVSTLMILGTAATSTAIYASH
jgi:polysaccharide export outer membrane protein